MRADRLVAVLLMLQRKGRVTAAEVAAELEVSERTARRDLEALGMAGLPVYSLQGRNGGWSLAGGGRTDLTGLSADEVRALFLLVGPEASVTPDLRAAIRKLTRALPEPLRATAESASSAVVDAGGWDQPTFRRRDPPLLGQVQQAVVEGRQVILGYVSREGEETNGTVHPLGLAVKGASWYLLADTEKGQRTFRVDRMRSVEPTSDRVERPEGFDLPAAWEEAMGRIEDLRMPVRARALVDPDWIDLVRYILGTRVSIGPPARDGRVEVELRGQSERSLAGVIAGLGSAVEVLEPASLRARLASLANELATVYGGDGRHR